MIDLDAPAAIIARERDVVAIRPVGTRHGTAAFPACPRPEGHFHVVARHDRCTITGAFKWRRDQRKTKISILLVTDE